MYREIRYRVLEKSTGRIFPVFEITFPHAYFESGYAAKKIEKGMVVTVVIETGDIWNLYEGEFVLMEYTGLEDLNGVHIFEGDIIRTSNERVLAVEIPNVFYWLADGAWNSKNDWEVIGNVYQHEHLLK